MADWDRAPGVAERPSFIRNENEDRARQGAAQVAATTGRLRRSGLFGNATETALSIHAIEAMTEEVG